MWEAIVPVLIAVAGVLIKYQRDQLKAFAAEVIAAVYRVAIKTAAEAEQEGIEWLRSEEGIAFRKQLVGEAYDYLLPRKLGRYVAMFVSRGQFIALVEKLFTRMTNTADALVSAKQ